MLIRSIRKIMKQIIWALVVAFVLWGVGTMTLGSKGRKGPTLPGLSLIKKYPLNDTQTAITPARTWR